MQNMGTETDPNVVYGGDLEETEEQFDEYESLGDLVLTNLKLGFNRTSFVSCVKVRSRSKVVLF